MTQQIVDQVNAALNSNDRSYVSKPPRNSIHAIIPPAHPANPATRPRAPSLRLIDRGGGAVLYRRLQGIARVAVAE